MRRKTLFWSYFNHIKSDMNMKESEKISVESNSLVGNWLLVSTNSTVSLFRSVNTLTISFHSWLLDSLHCAPSLRQDVGFCHGIIFVLVCDMTKFSSWVNVLICHLLMRQTYLQLMPHTQSRSVVWRGQPDLFEGHYAFLSPDGREALNGTKLWPWKRAWHATSSCWAKRGWYFPQQSNIYHLHSAAGPGPGRVNIMYGRGGSSWRLSWTGLNGELGSDDDSTWDNKAAHRQEWRWMLSFVVGCQNMIILFTKITRKQGGRSLRTESRGIKFNI